MRQLLVSCAFFFACTAQDIDPTPIHIDDETVPRGSSSPAPEPSVLNTRPLQWVAVTAAVAMLLLLGCHLWFRRRHAVVGSSLAHDEDEEGELEMEDILDTDDELFEEALQPARPDGVATMLESAVVPSPPRPQKTHPD
eukprot:GGOE01042991.1.p3 GENE.GGOE01042991.1~~GGOE01042991.1.p3  ORF type:complete len:139 (-),score=48.13 GGOE01042991.1:379-795(-)